MELGYAAADLMLVPGRRDDLRGDGRGRAAGDLRAATRTATRSRSATRCRWCEAGGGLLVDDAELTSDWIEQNVIPLVRDPRRLAAMGAAAAAYGRRDGDEALLDFVYEAVRR